MEDFAKVGEYQSLVKEIAYNHPEYFCAIEIANSAITKAVPNTQEQTKLLTNL
ncbi:hypothetical protein [Candidatus Tisiphia endosymbiont of Empis tessellata]|uniref:hypothetical protein n=1 Tax=Candidatus Tisiphia endosymbiont of Empis tessellata TaxID=3066259 RepID=UPI00313C18A3